MTTTPRVTKAVIPAAGLGTRFLPATKAQPKEMLPVVDKPAIQYVVEEAVRAGIDDILIITGRAKRSLEDHFDRNFELEYYLADRGKDTELAEVQALAEIADIHFVRQGEPLGLGHAVSVARKHVGDHSFAVLLGDDLMDQRARVLEGMMEAHLRTGSPVVAVRQVPMGEISSYGCIEPGDSPAELGERAGGGGTHDGVDGPLVRIAGIVEKPTPAEAPSDLAVMGRYVLTPDIFDALDEVTPGVGGEIQLTDAIALLIGRGEVLGYQFTDGRYDIGRKIDYLEATVRLALEREDLGPAFREFLLGLVRDGTLDPTT